jgi:hypothetical protein
MSEYNIALSAGNHAPSGHNKGGAGAIETVATIQNIVWQTRPAPPSDYENALGDALEALFLNKIYDLPGIVAGLNEAGLHGPDGRYWTELSFQAEMQRLGR